MSIFILFGLCVVAFDHKIMFVKNRLLLCMFNPATVRNCFESSLWALTSILARSMIRSLHMG